MTSPYHGSKISASQQSFLIFALSNDGRKSMVYRFVPSCTGKSYMSFFPPFFLPYLQDHGLLRSRDFTTMATKHGIAISPLY